MVGGIIGLAFSSFMIFNQRSKKAAISVTPVINNSKNGLKSLDNIKYLSDKVSEAVGDFAVK